MKVVIAGFLIGVSGLLGQEGTSPQSEWKPTELVQLRKAWLVERAKVGKKVDGSYLESLETMRGRLVKAGNAKGVEAVEKEIAARLAVTAMREGRLSDEKYAKGAEREKLKLTEDERKGLEKRLEGSVWRVDRAGEGLRWYYFEEGGKVARKSQKTEWVWSELEGEWKVAENGVVIVSVPCANVQIFESAKGEPQISLNDEGTLSVRPFRATELTYPGAGKE